MNSTPLAHRSTCESVRAASEIVPVTTVPTGNVKLHQVGPNGIPRRTARTVSAVAIASHSIANPHVGSPYSSANTSAPATRGARPRDRLRHRRYLEEALHAQAGLDRAPPVAELSSTTAIKAAVAAGIGPAVLSSLAIAVRPG